MILRQWQLYPKSAAFVFACRVGADLAFVLVNNQFGHIKAQADSFCPDTRDFLAPDKFFKKMLFVLYREADACVFDGIFSFIVSLFQASLFLL